MARLINGIKVQYAEAKRSKDAGAYRDFNKTYFEAQQQLAKIDAVQERHDDDDRRRMDKVTNRARHALGMVSPFSDEVIEGPEAIENFARRLHLAGSAEGEASAAPNSRGK